MITRDGIYYSLQYSNYRFTTNDITYVFSSKLHLEKFKKQYTEHRNDLSIKFTRRYGITIHLHTLSDVVLYKRIESRGFLIIKEGVELCQSEVILDGEKATQKS